MQQDKGFFVKMPGRTFKDIMYNLKRSFYYFKVFFWSIWWFRGFDYSYILILLKKGLEENLKSIENGYEEDKSKSIKIYKIKRVLYLLNNNLKDNYWERCGYDYDYKIELKKTVEDERLYSLKTTETESQKANNSEAVEKAEKLEDSEWEEIFNILKTDMRSWWS